MFTRRKHFRAAKKRKVTGNTKECIEISDDSSVEYKHKQPRDTKIVNDFIGKVPRIIALNNDEIYILKSKQGEFSLSLIDWALGTLFQKFSTLVKKQIFVFNTYVWAYVTSNNFKCVEKLKKKENIYNKTWYIIPKCNGCHYSLNIINIDTLHNYYFDSFVQTNAEKHDALSTIYKDNIIIYKLLSSILDIELNVLNCKTIIVKTDKQKTIDDCGPIMLTYFNIFGFESNISSTCLKYKNITNGLNMRNKLLSFIEKDNTSNINKLSIVEIVFPFKFRSFVNEDWRMIVRRNYILRLPPLVNVSDILSGFTIFAQDHKLDAKRTEYMMKRLKVWFKQNILVLLYSNEQKYYPIDQKMNALQYYGVEHLCRFLYRFYKTYGPYRTNDNKVLIEEQFNLLVKYIINDKNFGFDENNYEHIFNFPSFDLNNNKKNSQFDIDLIKNNEYF